MTAFTIAALALLGAPSDLPTVSIVMPTNARPEFVRRAIESIRRQDYPHELIKEVIVVDDSPKKLQTHDIMNSKFPRVLYTVLQEQRSVGRKRNIAALRATGDVIAHWDDDDMYGPDRLRAQVAPIARGDADITVLEHRWTYVVGADELYRSTDEAIGFGPHFGTLVYKRSLHADGTQYPDTSEAEDYGWAQRAVQRARARLSVVPTLASPATGEPRFTCVRHGSNTWDWEALRVAGSGARVPTSALSAADRAFAARARKTGLLDTLVTRRAAAPALRRFPPEDVDPNFFNHLYGAAPVPQLAAPTATQQQGAALPAVAAPRAMSTISYFDWQQPMCALVNRSFTFKFTECVQNKTVIEIAAKANSSSLVYCTAQFKCSHATYDLASAPKTITALPAPPAAGYPSVLGGAPLPTTGGYGGSFVVAGPLKLTAPLQLVYYTNLYVSGNLDCGGKHLFLGAWSNLTVGGAMIGCSSVTVGSFARLNARGNAAIGSLDALSGGACPVGLCDPAFFTSNWHELPDATCLAHPEVLCGCYLDGFQDGKNHNNCYYSQISVGGSLSIDDDVELRHYMRWDVAKNATIAGALTMEKFRPELLVGGSLKVNMGASISDLPASITVQGTLTATNGFMLSVSPNASWPVLRVGKDLVIDSTDPSGDGEGGYLYGKVEVNGTVESTYTLTIRLPARMDLAQGQCLFSSDVKVTKGDLAVSADEEAGTGLKFCGSVSVHGAGQLGGDSAAWHKTTVMKNLFIQDPLTLFDTHTVEVHGEMTLGSSLHVQSAASLNTHLTLNVLGDVYAESGAALTMGDLSAQGGVSMRPGARVASGAINATAISIGDNHPNPQSGSLDPAHGSAYIEANGTVVIGSGGLMVQGYSTMAVIGDLTANQASILGGTLNVDGSFNVAGPLNFDNSGDLTLSGDLTATSVTGRGLALGARNLKVTKNISIVFYDIKVATFTAASAALQNGKLVSSGAFSVVGEAKLSGTVDTGAFTVAQLTPIKQIVPGFDPYSYWNASYLSLATDDLSVTDTATLIAGMTVYARGRGAAADVQRIVALHVRGDQHVVLRRRQRRAALPHDGAVPGRRARRVLWILSAVVLPRR